MNRHGSINRIYRLIWNDALQAFVPAAETARGRGKRTTRSVAAAVMSLGASLTQAAPTGGHVTAGNGTVTQAGSTTTIDQASQNLALTWQSFNVGSTETVDFVQPSASAIAVNRIFGSDGSVILGHVNANGQVYLINPNGVLFGEGAQVNVGGLVASALDIDESTLGDKTKTFKGSGTGAVINDGTITTSAGGSIALLANHVGNAGIVTARLGTVALGAGIAVTLNFSGSHLVGMQVDRSVLESEARNGGLIQADGGMVVMTAGAEKSLLASVVNNTGIIEARTVDNHAGTITLLAGMSAGVVNVGGTLDAGAPSGGNGGAIETSGGRVEIAPSTRITAAAAHGLNGTWLIDPTDFTIAPSGGDETGAQLSASLAGASVTIDSNGGAVGTSGNINVNDVVSWSANTLTLSAQNNININAPMNGSGTASLALLYGQGAANAGNTSTYNVAAPVSLPAGPNFTTTQGYDGTPTVFTVITSLGAQGDELTAPTVATLQSVAAPVNVSGNFVLGANIDASATSAWNGCKGCVNGGAGNYGFMPIGALNPFAGIFDGLGHTISNLTINQPNMNTVGLFAQSGGIIRNVGLLGAAVTGANYSGAMVGLNVGTVVNSYSANGVINGVDYAGGLVGFNNGPVSGSSASGGSVNGGNYVGGLIGYNLQAVSASHVSGGSVSGTGDVGGFAGLNQGAAITQSYSTANVSGTGNFVGGFVGQNSNASITDSYATGSVTGAAFTGGFVGQISSGTLQGDYATGSVNGSSYTGGLAGNNNGAVSTGYASGNVVSTGSDVGGMIGYNTGSVSAAHASGAVSGTGSVGGLIGLNSGPVSNSYATGTTTGNVLVGGLIGRNTSSVTDSYATGSVTGASYYAGGLIGANYGSVTGSFASGTVSGAHSVGGLIGGNYGSVADSYASGSVAGAEFVGGLIGTNATVGTVSDSYAAGSVSAPNAGYLGGLIGLNNNSPGITNSFYSLTANSTNPTLTGSGGVYDLAGSIWGMSAANLQTRANFTTATAANGMVNPGWNLAATWIVYDGNTAPLLQSFLTPLTVTSSPVTFVYNGGAPFALTSANLSYSVTPDMTHLFGTASLGGTASGAAHVGTYTTAASGLYSDQLGYLITYNPGSLTITPATVTVSGSTASKVYDGTTNANVTGGTLVGVFAGDTLTLTQAGTFASPHVGTNIAVTVTDSLAGASAGDYTLTEPMGLTGSITPAQLTVTGTVAANKVYDGTTVAALSGGSLVGVIAGDTVTLTQAGAFATKNAGTGIPITANDGLSGAAASDYTLVEPTGLTATITPAILTVSGSTAGKVYDGTTNANVTGGTLVGVFAGDSLTLTQAGTFASPHVGTNIAVTATDSLAGASAGDYTLTEPTGITGTITPAQLTVTGTVAANKVYDGTTVAALSGGSLVGVIAGDTVNLTQAGAFATKNAGTGIAVTANDGLSGTAASNYNLVEPTGLTANITPAQLTVTNTTAANKVYDGTTVATLSGGSLVGTLAGDLVSLTQAGTFASKNAGTAIPVTANDSLSGAAASDYTIVEPTGLTANITPATLTVSGTTVGSRLYNGTDAAPVMGGSLVGVITGDTLSLSQSGTFASANAGTHIAVTATDSVSGTDASDYTLIQPTGLSGTIYPANSFATVAAQEALDVRSQIEADLLSPSFGDNPQAVDPSTSVDLVPSRTTAGYVEMKVGNGGTLRIEQGGLRLPDNRVQGNE